LNIKMKSEILNIILKKANDFWNYDFDFDGEKAASDTISIEGVNPDWNFDIKLKIWVEVSLWMGVQVADVGVLEFNVYDKDNNPIEPPLTDKEIIENVRFEKF